jgi:GNAT superfamily N-acetyltransferase
MVRRIMNLEPADALNQYGLPDLPFIIADPENTRYVLEHAQFSYIKDGSDTVGFIVFHVQGEQVIIYYIVFDDHVSLSDAEAFLQEFCSGKEVYALTYLGNTASRVFEHMGFYQELGLQYMEMDQIPHFRSSFGLEYMPIPRSKIPERMADLYNTCFLVDDGEKTLEEFIHDTFPGSGNAFVVKQKQDEVGFWIDVIYFKEVCFNCWIGIVPSHRRKGYGSQLTEYALNQARKKGCTRTGLLVNPKNEAAVKFYEKTGFSKKWGRIHFQSEPE